MTSVSVVVCDEQPIVREGVAQILRDAGFAVAGVAADPADLLRKARAHRPGVVVTDIRMSAHDGGEMLLAAQTIRRELPETGLLVLAQNAETSAAIGLLGDWTGGLGYLMKQHVRDLETLVEAVRRVAHGGSELDPDVVARLVARAREGDPLADLTPRERSVLELMAEGRSNRGIADDLVVTVAAVERHVTSIFDKLDLERTPDRHRRVLAVLRYLGAR
jgi:DNA-binding NarL/FixJ family response regulator